MKASLIITTIAVLAFPSNTIAAPIDNIALMIVIKSVCGFEPPEGLYEREYSRYLRDTGDSPSEATMSISLSAVHTRTQIGGSSIEIFCGDVNKTYGDDFYGD